MICETCKGELWLTGDPNKPFMIPCPDCHCGQQSCCEGASREEETDG